MAQSLLIENVIFEYKISDGDNGSKKLRGLFQKANSKNANGRVYTEEILKRESDKLQEAINHRRLIGQLDHPQTATLEYAKSSHVITNLGMAEGGSMLGELELLPTPAGKIALALVESKIQMGISSRGLGTVRKEVDESEELLVVNDDFSLITFDLVCEPSTPGAYLQPLSESMIRRILHKKDISKPSNLKKELFKIIDEMIIKRK